jgi:hypothetical protein
MQERAILRIDGDRRDHGGKRNDDASQFLSAASLEIHSLSPIAIENDAHCDQSEFRNAHLIPPFCAERLAAGAPLPERHRRPLEANRACSGFLSPPSKRGPPDAWNLPQCLHVSVFIVK